MSDWRRMFRQVVSVPMAAAVAMAVGCSSSTEDSTSAVSDALEQSGNSSNAVEVAGLMRGRGMGERDAIDGFRCDASPDIVYVSVCGRDLPATVHLEWTDCAPPERHGRGGGHGGHEAEAAVDGGVAADPPRGGHMGGHERSEGPGPSSGVVDIIHTYATPNGCDAAIEEQQVVTFHIERTNADGDVFTVEGTTQSTAQIPAGAAPTSKSSTVDITRSVKAPDGTVLRSVHLNGSSQVQFSDETPPTRTVNETMNAEFSDGTQGQVKLTEVVFPPMNVCRWPTSGTVERAEADGSSHLLVYGPDCGQATLDGSAIELSRRGGGSGRH